MRGEEEARGRNSGKKRVYELDGYEQQLSAQPAEEWTSAKLMWIQRPVLLHRTKRRFQLSAFRPDGLHGAGHAPRSAQP